MKGPLKLKWKQGKDTLYDLTNSIQAVVIDDNVYVGGGYTLSIKNSCTVMVYSLASESWSKLPEHKTRYFGMAAVNNQVVLVGGRSTITTGILAMWDEGSQTWTRPYPEMPTPRYAPSVISYQKWLVVAGGNTGRSHSNKVEILDTLSGQWYEGSPISSGCSGMSSAINGNMWYLSRGFTSPSVANKHVFCVSLDELISQALSQSAGDTSPPIPSPWQTLTDPPLTHSTVLILNGALLTIGGYHDSSAIYHYQPSSRSWIKVGDLPTKRYRCACTVLPNGEIFVVGGDGDSERVDTGAIMTL